MNLEEGIYTELSTDSGVTAIAGTRGYPLVIPQDASLPAWAYQRISGPRVLAHDGPTGLAQARVQFTCTAGSYDEAKSLANAIRGALDGFKGMLGGGVFVGYAHVENEIDGYQSASSLVTVRLDVNFLYKET